MNEDDNWVKLALCYAELAGHHPTTLLTDTLYWRMLSNAMSLCRYGSLP